MNVLEVKDLSIRLPAGADRPEAVSRASFTVGRGEILCLVGESGSGKSVIAQGVMGLLPRTLPLAAGSIRLNGEELVGMAEAGLRDRRARRMSMVFQEPVTALNPVMTCGDQVDELLRTHTDWPAAKRRQAVLDMFARVKLPDPERMVRSFPHQLSGGQRQRIVIAMAVILKPALLICDEPTTALDVTTQREILRLIKQLQDEQGSAVLFITHDMGVVADIADEVLVMHKGCAVEQGSRDDVLYRPQADYTRMLLSSVPSITPPPPRPVPSGAPLLRGEAVGKTYTSHDWMGRARQHRALQAASVAVRAGETVGIVGESGSGKSTLARCLMRLIEPTEGKAYWGDAEVAQLMDQVRLPREGLQRSPSQFSGGQRQRLAIARALACKPQVLVADEAVSALDVSVQAQIMALLREIQAELGLGLLFITHDLRVAAQLCDRVIVMHQGQIVEEGRTAELYAHPQQDYTRRLFEAAPGHNFAPQP